MNEDAATLWRAKDLIASMPSLAKGIRNGPGGSHCALGVLDEVAESYVKHGQSYDGVALQVLAVANELFPGRDDPRHDSHNGNGTLHPYAQTLEQFPICSRLAAFSNHPATTKDDLEAVFHKAALRADEVLGEAC